MMPTYQLTPLAMDDLRAIWQSGNLAIWHYGTKSLGVKNNLNS